MLKILIPLIILGSIFAYGYIKNHTSRAKGVINNRLAPCPGTPNCVCSFDQDKLHNISPISTEGLNDPMKEVVSVINNMDRTKIITIDKNYLHATFTSEKVGFVDDVEFLYIPNANLLHVRSTSRVGYGDNGVNRARVEAIRQKLTP